MAANLDSPLVLEHVARRVVLEPGRVGIRRGYSSRLTIELKRRDTV
jgi:hypothetical protein